MENKKNYIDGVDVSECTFWKAEDSWGRINACSQRFTRQCECANNSDCYYKQLKRLQQENERLKEEMCSNCDFQKQYFDETKKLLYENERLKEENEHYRKEAYRLADGLNKTENLAFIYKQALQEIKDIAEKEIVCDNCNFEGTDKCDARMCTHFYLNDFSRDIVDKINEVIGAE